MTTATIETTIVEATTYEAEYGFTGHKAIIDHPKHGRLLITTGFGGMDTMAGGSVGWDHGGVYQLKPGDTFESLNTTEWNEFTSLYGAVVASYDDSRPLLNWSSYAITAIAESVGL